VDILISYVNGIRVNLHLDLIGRPHERRITAVGEDGTLVYSYEDNAVKVSHTGAQSWETELFDCERNEMFIGAAKEFLALILREATTCSCGVEDGIHTLMLVDACRQSAQTGKAVALGS
jgi:predicted dehydrogenase